MLGGVPTKINILELNLTPYHSIPPPPPPPYYLEVKLPVWSFMDTNNEEYSRW
jgi:hypothetical protein